MNAWLGIDPGASGAIAIIGENGCAEAHKMCETEKDLWDLITAINRATPITYALIEELHALPSFVEEKMGIKRGSIATWKLAQHYGTLRAFLIAVGIPFEEKIPRTWQKLMGLQPHAGKNASKAKAQQLFPNIKITHAIADALLIACTARILWMNSRPGTSPVEAAKQSLEQDKSLEQLGLRGMGLGG